MPRYTVKVGHYLILETTFSIKAPERQRARELAHTMDERGTFGSIAWEVRDASVGGWKDVHRSIEIETVQEVQECG
jgi:hypothetical protein